jgi:hypothetical protein
MNHVFYVVGLDRRGRQIGFYIESPDIEMSSAWDRAQSSNKAEVIQAVQFIA